jgi:hypothetical protein
MGCIFLKPKENADIDSSYPELSDADLSFLLKHTGMTRYEARSTHLRMWKKLKGGALNPHLFSKMFSK